MKKAYQIDERKAIARFRSYLATNPGNIQLVLPLADLAQRMRHGVSQMLFETERELLMLIIGDEMKWLSQEHWMARWGTAPGSVIIHSQKVPVERPRLRDRGQGGVIGGWSIEDNGDVPPRWNSRATALWIRCFRYCSRSGSQGMILSCAGQRVRPPSSIANTILTFSLPEIFYSR